MEIEASVLLIDFWALGLPGVGIVRADEQYQFHKLDTAKKVLKELKKEMVSVIDVDKSFYITLAPRTYCVKHNFYRRNTPLPFVIIADLNKEKYDLPMVLDALAQWVESKKINSISFFALDGPQQKEILVLNGVSYFTTSFEARKAKDCWIELIAYISYSTQFTYIDSGEINICNGTEGWYLTITFPYKNKKQIRVGIEMLGFPIDYGVL